MPVKSPFTGEERIWIVKADGTVSQRCISKFKIEVRICKYAIQKIDNEQDNLRINQNTPNFNVIFSTKRSCDDTLRVSIKNPRSSFGEIRERILSSF